MGRQKRTPEQIEQDIKLQSKVCCVCEERKSFDEFYNLKSQKDGKSYRCKACDDLARKKWQEENPERAQQSQRARNIKYKYGLTMEQYDRMRKDQAYSCAICGKHEDENIVHGRFSSLSVDHNHEAGKIRGLLCNQCNRGLGMLGDSVESLEKALAYLKQTH